MSEDTRIQATANSYSPTSLAKSYPPEGSSEAPAVVPHLVSGVGPSSQVSSPTPVSSNVNTSAQDSGE